MLPITKVVLYSHGVGYFERSGEVVGDAAIDLAFKVSEINDVLKSLTTIDSGGGRVASVSYDAAEPLDRALAALPLSLPDTDAMRGLLAQMRGVTLRATLGKQTIVGRVLGLEQVQRGVDGVRVDGVELQLLEGGGTVRSLDPFAASQLEVEDLEVQRDLGRLLDLPRARRRDQRKRMTLFLTGEQKRAVSVGYTVEAPTWKTSYRVLLREDGGALLHGWALVDNTQEEDWDGVQLTLVAGLPVSFEHDLHTPRYRARPRVEVDLGAGYGPPQVERALSRKRSDATRVQLSAEFDGAGVGVAEAMAAAPEPALQVEAHTDELAELFQYVIDRPVTVRSNESALVPIVQAQCAAERVLLYNEEIRASNPMAAVALANSTGLTLEGGPVTVFERGTYVGEAMLATASKGEQLLLPYAVELRCRVRVTRRSHLGQVHRVCARQGTLQLSRARVETTVYAVQQGGDRAARLVIEHRYRTDCSLWQTPEPQATTEHLHRFSLQLEPGSDAEFVVRERRVEDEVHALGQVGSQQLEVWLRGGQIDAATRDALAELAQVNQGLQACRQGREAVEAERQQLAADQERLRENLRENLRALGASADEAALRERFVAELGASEDRLAALRARLHELEAERQRLQAEFARRIAATDWERAMAGEAP